MTWPTVTTEVAFGSDPFTASPSWTDISDRVHGIETHVGRTSGTGRFDADTLTVTLDSHDRRFDPLHTAGPYYGQLTPNARIKVTASTGTPTAPTFRSSASSATFSSGSTVTVTKPAGVVDGDLLLTFVGIRSTSVTMATPAGWTLVSGPDDEGSSVRGYLYSRVASSEPASQDWVASASSATVRVTTVAVENGATVEDHAVSTATTTAPSFGALTSAGASRLAVAGVVQRNNVAWTDPSGYTGQVDEALPGCEVATLAVASAGAVAATTGTYSIAAASAAYHVLVAPAAVAGDVLFDGLVDGWPNTYTSLPADGLVEVTASSPVKLLAGPPVPPAVWDDLADSHSPWLRWNLGATPYNGTGTTTVADLTGNGHDGGSLLPAGRPVGQARVGGSPVPADVGNLYVTNLDGPQPNPHRLAGTTEEWSVELWVYTPARPDDFALTVAQIVGVPTGASQVTVGGSPSFYVQLGARHSGATFTRPRRLHVRQSTSPSGTDAYYVDSGSEVVCDGALHQLVITRASSSADLKLYVDGTDVTGTPGGFGTPGSMQKWALIVAGISHGYDLTTADPRGYDDEGFTVSDAVWYDVELSAAEVEALYDAGVAPWDGDTTGERIGRLLDRFGWPAGWRDVDTGLSTVGPYVTDLEAGDAEAPRLLDVLEALAAAEAGLVYWSHPDGALRFEDRQHRLTATRSTTSQATITDDPAGTYWHDAVELAYDERDVVNTVTVTYAGGEVTATDASSVDAYGVAERKVDTRLATRAQAASLAEWLATRGSTPAARYRQVELNLAANHQLFDLLDLAVSDRVTVSMLPQGTGSRLTREVIVEGIAHSIGDGVNGWSTTLYLSEADATEYWVIGTSTIGETTRVAW